MMIENAMNPNSLTSSSSSSCSLYENKTNGEAKLNTNQDAMDPSASHNLVKFDETANLKLTSSNGGSKANRMDTNGNNGLSKSKQSYNGLKKPITFATIAAATSNNLINTINVNGGSQQSQQPLGGGSSNVVGGISCLSALTSKQMLSHEKIESILSEFKQNIYLLDLMYNQVNVESFLII